MYQERKIKPRRPDHTIRMSLVLLSRLFNWRDALAVVQPRTLIGWHRQGFKLFWRWKSRPGRPRIPKELKQLIREMALSNPSWGEEGIANELLLKLGIAVSPRTVQKYMPDLPPRGTRDQRWSTFVRNHADSMIACDFCTVVTATFHIRYVFIVIEHRTRRILHFNVTTHPTALWTIQQLREAIPADHHYRYLIHDRDCIFSSALDQSITNMGVEVLLTPYRSPQANGICERLIGTVRRECLDFLIPLTTSHLHGILKKWVDHYNHGRPHASIGPAIPDPPDHLPVSPQVHRHHIPDHFRVKAHPILGGLHHEYSLIIRAA